MHFTHNGIRKKLISYPCGCEGANVEADSLKKEETVRPCPNCGRIFVIDRSSLQARGLDKDELDAVTITMELVLAGKNVKVFKQTDVIHVLEIPPTKKYK